MAKTHTDFHTIVLVDKTGAPIRSIKLKTKHISRWKQYLALGACLFGLVASCLTFLSFKSTRSEKETAALHREIATLKKALADAHEVQANMPDSSQAREYLNNIDEKLKRISFYMKKRGIRGFSSLGVGGGNGSGKDVSSPEEMYSLYDDYLGRLLSGVAFTPLGYPFYNRTTSPFGYRSDPFGNGRELHAGIDIRGRRGDPARATADGRVEHAGWYGGYGNCVIVRHGNGYQTLYGHLSKVTVKKGERVHTGERVGKIGSTGHSTGNHLHYEVRQNGRPINPVRFLNL
ncbi:MAG: M23 family metallopeptidase [Mucilaginibacter polytrichastri]|nr:M23 family metallopeptidase [Mucilaginibacter polytrichastri]